MPQKFITEGIYVWIILRRERCRYLVWVNHLVLGSHNQYPRDSGYLERVLQSQAVTLGKRLVGRSFPCKKHRYQHMFQINGRLGRLRRTVPPQIGNGVRLDLFGGNSNNIPTTLNLGIIDIPSLHLIRRKSRPPNSL